MYRDSGDSGTLRTLAQPPDIPTKRTYIDVVAAKIIISWQLVGSDEMMLHNIFPREWSFACCRNLRLGLT